MKEALQILLELVEVTDEYEGSDPEIEDTYREVQRRFDQTMGRAVKFLRAHGLNPNVSD